MELVISKIVPAQIESNINQLEQFMLEVKEKYTGLVYTEDTIKTAKEQRAVLNKLEKGIAEVRRKAEKDSKIEIEEFIGKLKEAEKEIKLLSGDIDVQVKTFEEKERKNKYIEINELIDSKFINHEDLKDFLNVSTKWTNKTYSRNMIEEELELQFKELVKKKEFIADKLKEVNEILITTLLFKEFKYLIGFDYPAIISTIDGKKNERIRIETMLKQKAEENKEETQVEETKKEIIENNVVPEDIQKNEKIWNITLELIDISNSKAIALRKYLEENNIKFKLGGK